MKTEPDIHHLELKEAVLHDRLCLAVGAELPFILNLAPGLTNLNQDISSYYESSAKQDKISLAKVNYKRMLRAYQGAWRRNNVAIDLAISFNGQLGRRRAMVASMPAQHAQNAEKLYTMLTAAEASELSLYSPDFDPYVVLGMNPWLLAHNPQESYL